MVNFRLEMLHVNQRDELPGALMNHPRLSVAIATTMLEVYKQLII